VTLVSIERADDLRIADYRNISDAELIQRRAIFIAEGRLVVRRLLEGRRMRARSVMVTEPALAALRDLFDAHPALPVFVVPQVLMNTVAGFNIHRGCLAIGERPAAVDWRTLVRGARRIVVMERIANADNVGSIFRNAAAFGVDAVLLDEASTDPLYRKAIRTSMGAVLAVPFARVDAWPDALAELRAAGVAVIGLTPSSTAASLADLAAALPKVPTAIVLGHEGEGLSEAALSACDHLARISMAPGVDSLNVATAEAIALYALANGES
jgi:tRNA G18 (ribose-2'-O)-methylase SpoU